MEKQNWSSYILRFIENKEYNPNIPPEEDFSNLINELDIHDANIIYRYLYHSGYDPYFDLLSKENFKAYNNTVSSRIDFMKKNFNYTTDFFLKNNIWGNVSYKRKDFDIKDYVNDVVIAFNYGRLEIYVINIEKIKHTIKPLKKYLNTAPNMKLKDNKDGYFLCNYDVQTDIFNIIEAIKNIIEAKI